MSEHKTKEELESLLDEIYDYKYVLDKALEAILPEKKYYDDIDYLLQLINSYKEQ